MKLYSTVRAEASAEQIIEKSRFIAYVSPAETREEADEFTNVVVVVTRYFGGIKLGTGGLVRAYTSSAKLGLEAAGICDVCERQVMTYALDYTYLAKLQNLAGGALFTLLTLLRNRARTRRLHRPGIHRPAHTRRR